jgi:hypothetical protein
MLMILMIFLWLNTIKHHKPCEKVHKDIWVWYQLFSKLNNRPYVSYKWEMKTKKKAHKIIIMIILWQEKKKSFQMKQDFHG